MNQPKRILAIASDGGHKEQLIRILEPLMSKYDITMIIAREEQIIDKKADLLIVRNCSRRNFWLFPSILVSIMQIIKKERPSHVVTTGAAPGLAAVIAACLCGKKSMWIDSVANSNALSLSGRLARKFASQTVTQWKNIAVRYNDVKYVDAPFWNENT